MVPKLFWAALFFTPAVLGAALPEVQENALDLGRRDEVEIASLPLVARAEANVAVADEAAAPEEVDDEADVADADKKKKKKKPGHKKGKKKHGHKKGKKKHGHKKGPHDLEARDEAEVQAPGAEVAADDVDSDADVADADKKKKKKPGHKKGKKKHGHKKGKGKKKHGHKKGPHDLEAREEAAVAEEVVADEPDNEADVADADKKKKKKHGHKKGKKKHGHKKGKGKKPGHKKGPPHE